MATSKKDYIAIAAVIKAASETRPVMSPRGTREYIAVKVADYFATQNPAFDRARFLQACGVEP